MWLVPPHPTTKLPLDLALISGDPARVEGAPGWTPVLARQVPSFQGMEADWGSKSKTKARFGSEQSQGENGSTLDDRSAGPPTILYRTCRAGHPLTNATPLHLLTVPVDSIPPPQPICSLSMEAMVSCRRPSTASHQRQDWIGDWTEIGLVPFSCYRHLLDRQHHLGVCMWKMEGTVRLAPPGRRFP